MGDQHGPYRVTHILLFIVVGAYCIELGSTMEHGVAYCNNHDHDSTVRSSAGAWIMRTMNSGG